MRHCTFGLNFYEKRIHVRIIAMYASSLIASLCTIASASGQTVPIQMFRCTLGSKTAEVIKANGNYTYRYGRSGRAPDIKINSTGADGILFKRSITVAGGERIELRFVNGDASYIMYDLINSSGRSYGLMVIDNNKILSERECNGRSISLIENIEVELDKNSPSDY